MRQLRYFVALGQELSYRRAAEKLFITQPALSTAIKQIEQQFGVELFTRSTRGVALTEIGATWLPEVAEALRGVVAALGRLGILAHAGHGTLRIGCLIGTGADVLFRIARRFEKMHPEIRWSRRSSTSPIRPPGPRLPDLVHQEIWAYLIVHHATSELTARASAAASSVHRSPRGGDATSGWRRTPAMVERRRSPGSRRRTRRQR